MLTAASFTATDLVASADLNGDGKADVVLVHSSSVDVLLGNGAGGFAAAVNYPDPIATPAAVGLAAVNGDLHVDIVVASSTPDGTGNSPVATLTGDGSGAFGAATTTHYPGAITAGVLVDVNNDGHLDLISTSQLQFGHG